MSPKTNISESEWLAVLENARPKRPPGSKSLRELCTLWNCSATTAARRLRTIIGAGLATRHRVQWADYYVLTPPEKPKARH
jgi:hypothetical protein